MNKTFKVIFSKTRGALVAVNEAAKTTSRASVKTAVAGVCAALLSVPAMAAEFADDYCKDGVNCVVADKTVEGTGSVVRLDKKNGIQSITIKNSTISNTPFELRGSQNISVSDTVFTGLVSGTKRSFWIYAHNGYKTDVATEKATEVELNNVTFKDNTVSYGSLFVYDKTNLHMKGGAFVKNVTTDIGGGAMIKSGTIVFEDVLFQDNVARNESGFAAGGAVYVDITTGIKQNKKDSVGDVTFKLTKDMAYTGNRIDSKFKGTVDTWGWTAAPCGGFLFLDRYSKGAFDIADGVTLTIGTASATGEDDSIASALPNTKEQVPGYSTLVKKGAGTVVMYGSMDKYYGNFTVEAGTFDVRKAWNSRGNTTVTGGVLSASNGITLDTMKSDTDQPFIQSGKLTVSGEGTVTVKSLKLADSAEAKDKDKNRLPFVRIEKGGTLRADTIEVAAGEVTLAGGTLETGSAQVYNLGTKSVINADASKVSSEKDLNGLALKTGITATSGTLALTDKGYYTTASLKAMSGALKASSASLSFLNSKLYKAAGETAELVDSVIQSTEQVTASSEVKTNADGKVTAQVTVKNSGAQTVVVKDSAQTGAKAVDQVTFAAPEGSTGEMTLVGSAAGGHLVQNTAGKAVDVEVAPDLRLNLGQTELPEQTTGTLSNLTLSTGTTDRTKAAGLTVANIVAAVEKLVAAGNNIVTVGNERKRGVLKIGALDLGAGSKVFVDPAWQNDAALNTIGNASHLEIAQVESLRGSLIAGQNSLITIGATAAQAEAAFNQAGLNWGKEAVSAALYLGSSVNPEGGILVNGNLTSASDRLATTAEGMVTLAAGSLLMVDAAAVGEKAVTGTVSAVGGAKVALVNAAEGTFKLTDTVTGLTSASFVSDNLFTTTALNGSDVSTTVDKNALGGAVASMGLQSMIRRADSVLAATVADRTSIDQELGAGANLWVDVGGESYEADGFDNNASFKSDMGYGVFGADVAVSDDITLGAALQYGTGSARSSNFGMKNEIDTWGLTAYSVYKTGDARFVGEVAYVKAKNDISASAASKLSQSVDTEMLSAGMSAHYQFDAGAVTVTPSLGIRLSQLKTDALKVGAIRIADDEMTVFQVPVAVRVGMKPVEASGWNIAPAVKLAYVPTFGDDETDILEYQQKVLDTSPVQADIGVEARKGNFMVNVNFLAGTGSEGAKAVGGKVGVKYLF
ncbi:autotransporter domain-containing protein [uncultured Duodenibacillus sp.]|uniref:autotransporter domain-containing protein n=1 Tax=uncultured Duodenibacillus sp. TaxID=1980699 RepID=UPI002585BC96|nr:autotransporter domain-containing protein [uncultured Duodenibacillus sp.]